MNAIEIDFLPVGNETKCGDAIAVRYGTIDSWELMVVDGGDLEAGSRLVEHISAYYGANSKISHVVCTHCDQDHVSGLRPVLDAFQVDNLWVHQPWEHADELLPVFKGNWQVANLSEHLRNDCFPIVSQLCDAASSLHISLREPLAGERIGPFSVLAPGGARLLELFPQMDQTPAEKMERAATGFFRKAKQAIYSVFESWSYETLLDPGPNGTSIPNETSVVLYSEIGGGVLLTGDAGVGALSEAATNAATLGVPLLRPAFVQMPHHGSRHNVSPSILDSILGPAFPQEVNPFCMAYASVAAKSDFPRRQVENAFRRRGYNTQATKGRTLTWKHGFPNRPGWTYGLSPGAFHAFVEA